MKHLAVISHNFFRAIGFHKSRSPSSPYGPAPQGSQLITLGSPSFDRASYFIQYLTRMTRMDICSTTLTDKGGKKRQLRYSHKHIITNTAFT